MQEGKAIDSMAKKNLSVLYKVSCHLNPTQQKFPIFSRENDGIIVGVLCILGSIRGGFCLSSAFYFTLTTNSPPNAIIFLLFLIL